MALAGTGAFNLPLEALRNLLAACTAFQTWTGAANAAAAEASIDIYGEINANFSVPRAIIMFDDATPFDSDRNAGGAGGAQFWHRASAEVWFFADVDTDYDGTADGDWADAMMGFMNSMGAIMDEFESTSGTGTHLDTTGWQKVAGPTRTGKEEGADRLMLAVRVPWEGI